MKKRTPGPWELCEEKDESLRKWIIMGPSQDPDLKVEPVAILSSASKEDAQLIAAAPDLLDACKEIQGMFERGEIVRDVTRDGDPDWITKMLDFVPRLNKLMAAIAKAEGK